MDWIDDEETKVLFVAEDGTSRAGQLKARRSGEWYCEGTLERDGKRTPTCFEFA